MSKNKLKNKSVIHKVFSNNAYCFLAMLCTAGLMLLIFYCYDLFPFGDKTILRMDLYHQYGPLFAELYDRITNLESLVYSWRTGLGSPFLGNYFNYLSSPSAIIILLLGHKNMPESIAFMIMSKAMFSAFTFSYYLKKSQKRHDFTSAAFGVLYSMCGYFIAYYWNVMWIDAMVFSPLVILGIEKIIDERNPRIYIAFLTLTLFSNYYMGYMTCIMSVAYFLVYYFSNHEFTEISRQTVFTYDADGKKNYKLTEKLKGSILLRSGATFALSSLAAGCLVAFSLIPTYFILKSCSATSGSMPENYSMYFSIFDFLANHLGSVEPTIRSSGEDVLPNVYCGIATLILVPLYLFTRSVSLKEKVAHVALLGFIFASFNLNYLNYIWHGFHFPNDLPYRFSFMYSFVLLVIAYKAFIRLREFTGRQILGAGCCLLFAIIMIQENGSKNVQDITILMSIIFTVTYCLVFYVMKTDKYQKGALSVLLLCCVVGEYACCNTDRFEMNQYKKHYCSDYNDFRELKENLDEIEGTDKYRMELTYNRARMDPAWYGYNGVSTFTSMAYEKMANMQSDLGLCGNYINSYTYYLQTPVYNMINSLKYIVDNNSEVTVENDYFKEIDTVGNFTAYENKYYLPIATVVNDELAMWYTDYSNPFIVQGDWFEYATGVQDVYSMMDIANVTYYNMNEITSGLDTGDIYFTKKGSGNGELTFYLTVEKKQHCYLYVNSSAFEQITINKNGVECIQSCDEPYIYDLGIVEPNDDVNVFITIENDDYGYIDFFPYYINQDKLDEGYKVLKDGAMNIESFKDTKIKGTVSASEDKMVFTSIPYDQGWTVKVDGKPIDNDDYISLCDAYLCFNIEKGNHTVEITYKQRGLVEGLAISGLTIICLILAYIIFKRLKPLLEEKYNSCEIEQEARLMLSHASDLIPDEEPVDSTIQFNKMYIPDQQDD